MSPRLTPDNPAVLSYHTLRRTVGVIALALPFLLAGGAILLGLAGPGHGLPRPLVQRSISDYYYTPMGNCFVGSLCVIAAFLMCSRGYDLHDEVMGYLAGAFTLGVALFPSPDPRGVGLTPTRVEIGFVHATFAALMFISLAYFCLALFRRSSPGRERTRRKQNRDRIYKTCGFAILICNAIMISLVFKPVARALEPFHPLFCSETVALLAFGVAWITKGEGFLKDRRENHVQAR